MGITQIAIISVLAVIQLIALIILISNAENTNNIKQFYFTFLFMGGSLMLIIITIGSISRNNEYKKQETICPQYEQIEDKVYRLK